MTLKWAIFMATHSITRVLKQTLDSFSTKMY